MIFNIFCYWYLSRDCRNSKHYTNSPGQTDGHLPTAGVRVVTWTEYSGRSHQCSGGLLEKALTESPQHVRQWIHCQQHQRLQTLNGYNYSSLNVFLQVSQKEETTGSQARIADRTASQYAEPDSQIAMVRPSSIPNLKSLAQVVLEILMPQWFTWPWTTSKQRSKSIHFGTNRFLIYDFL